MPPPLLLRHLLTLRSRIHSISAHSHLLRTASAPSTISSVVRSFSSPPSLSPAVVSPLAQTISSELIKHANAVKETPDESAAPRLSLEDHLSLHYSDVRITTPVLLEILNLSTDAGRDVIDFFRWLVRKRSFQPNDDALCHLVCFFGRRHDFKSVQDVLAEYRRGIGAKTFHAAVDRLIRADRPEDAVRFFQDMEQDYGIKRDRAALTTVVSILCDHGYGKQSEHLVKRWATRIFPDDEICHALVKGWCVGERPDEAIRLMGEMVRGGFEPKTPAYNSILDSVCKLSRKKDPLTMKSEAEKVLLEMEAKGVARDTETFRILVSNLCKIRKTEDAVKLFDRMSEWGCSPDAEIYLTLIRSLYQAARISEGDDMVNQMWSAGFKSELDTKECYGFLKILCGIERVEHAMKVFRMLKRYGFKPGVQTYELLMERLCAHNLVDKANALYREAQDNNLDVTPKEYAVDPRYVKKREVETTKKKRLTLPQKMLLKRKRLRKLKLSFVKKPRKRRAY